jgi:hypothetical protein
MIIKIYDKNVLGNRLLGTTEYSLSSLVDNFQEHHPSSPLTSSLELTISSVTSSDNSSLASTPCIIYRKISERLIPSNENKDSKSIGTLSLHYTLTSSSSSLQ